MPSAACASSTCRTSPGPASPPCREAAAGRSGRPRHAWTRPDVRRRRRARYRSATVFRRREMARRHAAGGADRQSYAMQGDRIERTDALEEEMRRTARPHVVLGMHLEPADIGPGVEDVPLVLGLQPGACTRQSDPPSRRVVLTSAPGCPCASCRPSGSLPWSRTSPWRRTSTPWSHSRLSDCPEQELLPVAAQSFLPAAAIP